MPEHMTMYKATWCFHDCNYIVGNLPDRCKSLTVWCSSTWHWVDAFWGSFLCLGLLISLGSYWFLFKIFFHFHWPCVTTPKFPTFACFIEDLSFYRLWLVPVSISNCQAENPRYSVYIIHIETQVSRRSFLGCLLSGLLTCLCVLLASDALWLIVVNRGVPAYRKTSSSVCHPSIFYTRRIPFVVMRLPQKGDRPDWLLGKGTVHPVQVASPCNSTNLNTDIHT